jgi:hypothetical protein
LFVPAILLPRPIAVEDSPPSSQKARTRPRIPLERIAPTAGVYGVVEIHNKSIT